MNKVSIVKKQKLKMWQIILIALVLGMIFGIFLSALGGTEVGWIAGICDLMSFLGNVFIRLIRMVVVPLVFFSIVAAIVDLKNIRELRNIGVKTVLFFTLTSAVAITIGLILSNIIKPGYGLTLEGVNADTITVNQLPSIYDTLLDIIPLNIGESFANGTMMQIIFFSVFLGIAILLLGPRGEKAGNAFKTGASIMYKIIDIIVYYIPVGVFALMANAMAVYGTSVFGNIFKFILTDYLSALLQVLIVYIPLLIFVAKVNPFKFLAVAFETWLVAFSTCTSSASLPVSMKNAQNKLGISKDISSFVLPFGATANMDGTGIFFGIIVVFAAQIAGVQLTVTQMVMLVLQATLLSVGCAAVPQIGLVIGTTMIISMGLPVEVVGLVTGIYRIIDQIHTATNATGDLVIATCIAQTEGQLDREIFERDHTNYEQALELDSVNT
ncbi:MAG: Amino acid:cation symporter [Oscillospiraceae bacterium]|jgi:Na+/H+-dicarboxylate symporter